MFFTQPILASNGRTTYQGKIYKPDGYPLEAANVDFRFTVLDPSGSCVLYIEDYPDVNMVGSGGFISLSLGTGSRAYPTSGTLTFSQVFDNTVPMFTCQSPGFYNPAATDNRKLVMQFNDNNGWQTLPAMAINAVPYAMYADKSTDAAKLNGKADTDFVEVTTLANLNCTAGQAIQYTGSGFACIDAGDPNAVTNLSVSGSVLSLTGTASSPIIGISAASPSTDGYVLSSDYNEFKAKMDNTAAAIASALGYSPVSAAAVSSMISSATDPSFTTMSNSISTLQSDLAAVSASAGNALIKSNNLSDLASATVARTNLGLGDLSILNVIDLSTTQATGIIADARLQDFVSVVSGTQYTKLTVDGKGRVVSGAQLDSSDVITALGYTPANSTSGITSFNGSSSQTQTLANSLTGTTPAFVTNNGVHTLNIPYASEATTTAGLISNSEYSTFMNKITSSAASIAQVLGYTPAASSTVDALQAQLDAVSGTAGNALVKSNNLSDLASATVARTNLGLGDLSILNVIDLSTSQATGIIADARLQDFVSVVSGTQYTKLTVDGKGRVVSGAQLDSSDVTTALGYTPAESGTITSSQWTTSGSTINYMTGNVGIGTNNPTSRLTVGNGTTSEQGIHINALTSPLIRFQQGGVNKYGIISGDGMSFHDYTAGIARLSINSTGNVGIGTSSASAKLEIVTSLNDGVSGGLRISNGAWTASGRPSVDFHNSHPSANFTSAQLSSEIGASGNNSDFIIKVADSSKVLQSRLYINKDGNIAIGSTSPATKLSVSGGLQISMESATCAVSYAGTLRYNAGNVEFCNGSTWAAFGVAGSGITSFNGSTSGTQSFANSLTGTTPAFVTNNGVHTLNIPYASEATTTAGLISNSEYSTFMNKITSSAASIAQVLGYVPAASSTVDALQAQLDAVSGTAGNALIKSNNLSDLASATVARTNLGLGSVATLNSIDLSSTQATGIVSDARLADQAGVTSGTQYTKLTVDGKGRVVSGAQLASADVTTALGYTPASATASTQWTTSGSTIYYNTGNVGIGTSGPQRTLHIVSSGSTYLRATSSGGGYTGVDFGQLSNGYGLINVRDSMPLTFFTSGTQRMVLDQNGNLGIGNSVPNSKLVVKGSGTTSAASALNVTNSSDVSLLYVGNDGAIGIGTSAPVTKLAVSGGLQISMESGACAVGLAGTLRYNAGNVEFCNGSTWAAFGVSGAGVQSFNGSTSGTQSFANSLTGTTPAFVTNNGVHTLNIPYASEATTTAGLISNSDFINFTNKLSIANNLSDLASATVARTNLGLGSVATLNSIDLSSTQATGIVSDARLADQSGVVSGTQYTKVTVDGKGRVVSGAQLASTDVTTALGYTPASASASTQWTTSGSTINYMTGNVGVGTTTPSSQFEVVSGISGIKMGFHAPHYGVAIDYGSTGSWAREYGFSQAGSKIGSVGILSVASSPTYLYFNANQAGATTGYTAAQMVLTASGNVGIGTTAPASPLEVNGDITATGGPGALNLKADVNNHTYIQFFARSATPETRSGYFGYPGSGTIHMNLFNEISSGSLVFGTSGTERLRIDGSGNIGVGYSAPTAKLQLAAGTSSLAPLKFTSGTLLSSPQSGTMEYDGFNFYLTDGGGTRRTIATGSGSGSIDNASVINSSGNMSLVPVGSVIVSSTTASTDSQTGALVVNGGMGVVGNIYSSGTIVTSSNIQGASITATSGMISPYIAGSIVSGGSLTLDSTTHANKGNILFAVNGGNVGIGTIAPTQMLEVAGNINVGSQVTRTTASINRGQLSGSSTYVQTSAGSATVNWNNGNIQEINTFVCNGTNTITMTNMRDGAAYSILLSGTAAHSGLCVFSAAGMTFKTSGGALAPMSGKDILFTFAVINNIVIYNMSDNLQ